MKLFGFRSKPEWQHPDGARRAAAVASGNASELLVEIQSIARSDADPRVRLAAVRRLGDAALLHALLAGEREAAVREAIDERLIDLARLSSDPPDDPARAWLCALPVPTRMRLAREAVATGWRRAALGGIDRPAFLIERCLGDPDPALRIELVDRIDDPDALERIAQKARREDKRLARAASERAQAQRLAAGDADALRAAALAVGERLAALRREPLDTLTAGVEACTSTWRELAPRVDAATVAIVEGHFAQARASIERARGGPAKGAPAPTDAGPDPQAMDDAPEAGGTGGADHEDEGGIAALQLLVEACEARIDELDHESLDGLRAGFDDAWRALAGHGPRARAIRDRFETVTTTARRRLDEARRTREAERRAREDVFRQSLGALEVALEQASVPSARAALGPLDAALAALGEIPRDMRRRESTARQGFATLVARQRWSLNRQRAELADAAEALLGQGLHPDAVAGRVRELREAWERLDAIARAAGDEPDPESGLARRFRALASKALAPTRKYFSERQKLRGARADEFEALALPIESAQADDRSLALRRRAVANALRRLDEVDPARRGELGRRLREALGRLDASRRERAESAESARRRLLANLGRRLARADLATALAAAREAESEWGRLPRARPEDERRMRAEFDALVGPWFERERAGRADADAARGAVLAEATAIVAELEALGGKDGGGPAELEHRIAALRRRWQALEDANRPPRPAVAERGPRRRDEKSSTPGERPAPLPTRRFDAALEKAEAARHVALARAEADARARRLAPVMALRALEAEADAVARGLAAATPRLAGELAPALADASTLPAGLLARRDAAMAMIEGRGEPAAWIERTEAGTRAARELALRAECCAGLDSPPGEEAERRRVQVARLEARMRGGATPDPRAEIDAIEDAWRMLGPVGAADAGPIEARIALAATAIRGRSH
jgi:hypothetical protein